MTFLSTGNIPMCDWSSNHKEMRAHTTPKGKSYVA